jgi:hypothetical protein
MARRGAINAPLLTIVRPLRIMNLLRAIARAHRVFVSITRTIDRVPISTRDSTAAKAEKEINAEPTWQLRREWQLCAMGV